MHICTCSHTYTRILTHSHTHACSYTHPDNSLHVPDGRCVCKQFRDTICNSCLAGKEPRAGGEWVAYRGLFCSLPHGVKWWAWWLGINKLVEFWFCLRRTALLSLGWCLLCPLLARSLWRNCLYWEVNMGDKQKGGRCMFVHVQVVFELSCSSGSICSISIWPWESITGWQESCKLSWSLGCHDTPSLPPHTLWGSVFQRSTVSLLSGLTSKDFLRETYLGHLVKWPPLELTSNCIMLFFYFFIIFIPHSTY